jgi:type II secretion system protein I
MAVISIALVAIGNNTRQQINQAASLRQSTLAGWVADNVVTESRLGLSSSRPGLSSGSRRMGKQDWNWTLQAQPSPDPDIIRLDVVVRDTGSDAAAILQHTGFSLVESE